MLTKFISLVKMFTKGIENMSKLYGKFLVEKNELNWFEYDYQAKIRYLSSLDMFEFKCVDVYELIRAKKEEVTNVRISPVDIIRLISVDRRTEEEKNELYYHEMLKTLETGEKGANLVDSVLSDSELDNVSMVQRFFHVSTHTLILAKRQAHLRKLNRVESSWVDLKRIKLHSNGGRKVGSKKIPDPYHVENYDVIALNCAKHDWFHEFSLLSREVFPKMSQTEMKKKWKELRVMLTNKTS